MTAVFAILIVSICVAVAVYVAGRKSVENKNLKEQIKTDQVVNEILKNQRDDRIVSINLADRMWDEQSKN